MDDWRNRHYRVALGTFALLAGTAVRRAKLLLAMRTAEFDRHRAIPYNNLTKCNCPTHYDVSSGYPYLRPRPDTLQYSTLLSNIENGTKRQTQIIAERSKAQTGFLAANAIWRFSKIAAIPSEFIRN